MRQDFYQQSLRPGSVLIIECRLRGAGADSSRANTFDVGPALSKPGITLSSTPCSVLISKLK
jgi:hypothetical protein